VRRQLVNHDPAEYHPVRVVNCGTTSGTAGDRPLQRIERDLAGVIAARDLARDNAHVLRRAGSTALDTATMSSGTAAIAAPGPHP